MSSAITVNTTQLKANNVFNADNTPIYNSATGDWTLKNASGVTTFTVASNGALTAIAVAALHTFKASGTSAQINFGRTSASQGFGVIGADTTYAMRLFTGGTGSDTPSTGNELMNVTQVGTANLASLRLGYIGSLTGSTMSMTSRTISSVSGAGTAVSLCTANGFEGAIIYFMSDYGVADILMCSGSAMIKLTNSDARIAITDAGTAYRVYISGGIMYFRDSTSGLGTRNITITAMNPEGISLGV